VTCFGIKEGYAIRTEPLYSNEETVEDKYQNEVYLRALELLHQQEFSSVLDVGTGRGFKLVKYFSEYRTLGLDLPPTVNILRSFYPLHQWDSLPLDGPAPQGYELLICSDVIEHVLNPDDLLTFIERAKPKLIVISTPDRDLFEEKFHAGPPSNWCHVREWSFAEFEAYLAAKFEILEHFHSNQAQKTQCVVARLRTA
jgi:hypothetical protein